MKKINKILCLVTVAALLVSVCVFMTACGDDNGGNGGSAVLTLESEDGKYEFHATKVWSCWITEKGKSEKLIEGALTVREENAAITIVLGDDILDMNNTSNTFGFSYSNEEKGIDNAVFSTLRMNFLTKLEAAGIIIEVAAGGGGFFGASFLFWNNGDLQLKILKVQSTTKYTYSKADGLKVENAVNCDYAVETNSDGNFVVSYANLTATLPGGMGNSGSVTVPKADLEEALMLE